MKLKQQQAVTIYESRQPVSRFQRKAFHEKRWVSGDGFGSGYWTDERVVTTTVHVRACFEAIYLEKEQMMIVKRWVTASDDWLDWPEAQDSPLSNIDFDQLVEAGSYEKAIERAVLWASEWRNSVIDHTPATDARTDEQVKADAIAVIAAEVQS